MHQGSLEEKKSGHRQLRFSSRFLAQVDGNQLNCKIQTRPIPSNLAKFANLGIHTNSLHQALLIKLMGKEVDICT
jgi:hypothetical protein